MNVSNNENLRRKFPCKADDNDFIAESEDEHEAILNTAILEELETGSSHKDTTVLHPINQEDFETFPTVRTNNEVAFITVNCEETLTCDLYYEPDWNFKLSV